MAEHTEESSALLRSGLGFEVERSEFRVRSLGLRVGSASDELRGGSTSLHLRGGGITCEICRVEMRSSALLGSAIS